MAGHDSIGGLFRLVSSSSLSLPALRAALSAQGQSLSLQELRQMSSTDLKQSIAQVGHRRRRPARAV